MTKQELRQYRINKIAENLEKSLIEAEEYAKGEGKDTSMQYAYQAGWLQGSIRAAIIELKYLNLD